jgi:tetratricopeptide (TPR) repeat protein
VNTIIKGFALTVLLVACASPPPTPPAPIPPLREKLGEQNRIALTAFESGRFEQAADIYDQALTTATAMDDSAAIVDAHYNRAVSLMLAEKYPQARLSIHRAEDELSRVGRTPPPELTLLSATLAYRVGDDATAWTLTTVLTGSAAPNQIQVANRAWFLRGLLANRRDDNPELNLAIEVLRASPNSSTRADRLELEGYRAAAAGDSVAAVVAFDQASRARNEIGDYRGMSRSLVAAAEVLEEAGRKLEAADRYLRAGRSAASRGSMANARVWLESAEKLAGEADAPGIAAEARMQLQQIDQHS